jgi:hypothetical protein
MKPDLFDELVESVREGADILKGRVKPSRTFVIEGPDIKRIRVSYRLSQTEFAALMGISVGRVAPGLAPWRSRRSVRAQLRHTARQRAVAQRGQDGRAPRTPSGALTVTG